MLVMGEREVRGRACAGAVVCGWDFIMAAELFQREWKVFTSGVIREKRVKTEHTDTKKQAMDSHMFSLLSLSTHHVIIERATTGRKPYYSYCS